MIEDEDYWHADDILSRNAMFNMVIGGRGCGKTYDCVRRCIRRARRSYALTGCAEQFIYLRRYKSELDDRKLFFSAVKHEFPTLEFKVEGWSGYFRKAGNDDAEWIALCHFIPLSTALTKKSVPYPDVKTIVFDEFIIDKGAIRYLPNECKCFLDFYNTVDRFEDRVRVLMLANAVSVANPYFFYYDIRPRDGARFQRYMDGYLIVENVKADNYAKTVAQTRFGKMIANTSYYDYAVDNKYADDDEKLIMSKTERATYSYGIRWGDKVLGVWIDSSAGLYFVTERTVEDVKPFVLVKEDMQPNSIMLDRTHPLLRGLRKVFTYGIVRFDSVRTRALFFDIMRQTGL